MSDRSVLDLGNITIQWLRGGNNKWDGGAMFGPVPKALWSKKNPADEDNYHEYVNNPLLVQTPSHNILIDSGVGNKLTEKQHKIFGITREWDLVDDLERVGLKREDIDGVISTHCDFDHAGGIVMETDNQQYELTFPKADHVIQKQEWEDVCAPNIRSAHSYFAINFGPLKNSDQLRLVEGDMEVFPGISVRHTGGHTRGHQVVVLHGETSCAVHMGDIFPTHHHANPLWVMAFDNFPLEVIEQKKAIFEEYKAKNCWFTFYHDIAIKACKLGESNKVIEIFK
jgi:glyoxylase-like metal-dependent hydrolase (beta-lactamase superfamily II)